MYDDGYLTITTQFTPLWQTARLITEIAEMYDELTDDVEDEISEGKLVSASATETKIRAAWVYLKKIEAKLQEHPLVKETRLEEAEEEPN